MGSRAIFDHIIIKAPTLESLTSTFESNGFTVTKGGRHADGLTHNALVILPDGFYFELLAFVPGAPEDQVKSHWWYDTPSEEGYIDFSLALPSGIESDDYVREINGRGGELYEEPPRTGGRMGDGGNEFKWKVAFPRVGEGQGEERSRGRLPFWCEDLTERKWRVPTHPSMTTHPNQARGITRVVVLSNPTKLSSYLSSINNVLSLPEPTKSTGGAPENPLPPSTNASPADYPPRERVFTLSSAIGGRDVELVLREPANEEESMHVRKRGEGLYEVVIEIVGGGEGGPQRVLDGPTRIVLKSKDDNPGK